MINKWITGVISVVFLGTVFELIMPDGGMKKYYKLVMGFVIMSVLITPISVRENVPEFDFSFEALDENEIKAESDAYILKLHEENIRNRIYEVCQDKSVKIFIELYSDGRVKSVNLRGEVTQTEIMFLKTELGCENINLISGEENES